MALALLAITTTEILGSNPTVSKIFFVFVNCIKEMKTRGQKWPKNFYEIIHFSFDPCWKKVEAKIRTKQNEEMGMGNFVSMDNKF